MPPQAQHVQTWLDNIGFVFIALAVLVLVFGLVVIFVFAHYFRFWIQSKTTHAGIGILDLIGMTFRKVSPGVIVRSKIMAVQAGIGDRDGVTSRGLEAHYLAGGNVPLVIRSLIAAHKAKLELDFKLATAIDLAGRNVLEAVQTSVNPKVIDCPSRNLGRETLDGVAQNGVQLKVKARVTVRANLRQLIGGATEETIIARVGEGIVSAIGSAESHHVVLETPDRISKTVLARRLDSHTAFEIVSIDIAEVTVGENIGARLQADRAEADMRVARANAEGRRAMAVAAGAGNDRPDRREPGEGGRGGGRGPQGDCRGVPGRRAGHHGLLQASQRTSRYRYAVGHRPHQQPCRLRREEKHHVLRNMNDFGIILLIVLIVVPLIGVVASRMREMSQQQPQRPMAAGDNRRIQEQIEEFLRRANQGRAQPPAQKKPPVAPVPVEVLDDDQVGSGVGQQVRQYLDTSEFRRRSAAMGGEVFQADEQFTQQVSKAFSGEVGKLSSRRGDTAAAPEVVEAELVEADTISGDEESRPTLAAPPAAGTGLADLLGSSDNIAHAIIMNEILRRPEW